MKTVGELMTREVVWVSPSAPVKTAVILMKGHKIGALPVVEADESVVGLVTLRQVLGEPPDAAVSGVMQTDFPVVDPGLSVHEAAGEMHRAGTGHLIIIEEGRLSGIVSRGDILPELGKSFDPLTDLPWSDTFREWATAALKRRKEIAVIFFDLDNYGAFNKKHGHVVGDRIIKEVAEVIKKGTDPELDLACRYAGDEFAIASIRHADEARALAAILQERIAALKVEGLPGSVSGTFGMSGGRRSREREEIHYAATIDDLITRASKDCTAKKPGRRAETAAPGQVSFPGRQAASQPTAPRAARLRIRTIGISTSDTEASATVTLTRGENEYKHEASGYATGGRSMLRLVAEAAAGAARASLAPEHGITIDDVLVQSVGADEEIISVIATFVARGSATRTVGSAVVKRADQHRATAAATLDAINRLLETASDT